jgi:hypothetical protein
MYMKYFDHIHNLPLTSFFTLSPAEDMCQEVKHLPSKFKALSSNPRERERKREREREGGTYVCVSICGNVLFVRIHLKPLRSQKKEMGLMSKVEAQWTGNLSKATWTGSFRGDGAVDFGRTG